MHLDGKKIKAWGVAWTTSHRGFNLSLVVEDVKDLYGQWMAIHVPRNPEPFELRRIINMGPMQRKVMKFDVNMLNPLIEETL
jgi:hypothetical protein